jgi:CubicO group peptidase (beta-lactamase class C family)
VGLKRIAPVVQGSVEPGEIADAVTPVARHGGVVWFEASSKQDREGSKPMRTDSIFRICSMTKPIVTLAVMMLYEEGRLLLDDPISKYIPEFGDQGTDYAKRSKTLYSPSDPIDHHQ